MTCILEPSEKEPCQKVDLKATRSLKMATWWAYTLLLCLKEFGLRRSVHLLHVLCHERCMLGCVASASGGVQVFFHLTVRREDERVLETTRLSEDGVEGSGVPRAYMLGKGQRMPRGWELALYGGLLPARCPVLACMH